MNVAATIGVLNDVFLFTGLVSLAGVIVYAIIRSQTNHAWNFEGNVLTRPYGIPDALVALGIALLFGWSVLQMHDPAIASTPPEAASPVLELIVGVSAPIFFGIILILYMGLYREMAPAEMFGLRSLSVPVALGIAAVSVIAIWFVIAVAVSLLDSYAFGGIRPDESSQQTVETFRKAGNPLYKILLAFSAVVIAPLSEEIIFRGFLYGVVKRYTDRWFATFLTALFFAAVHQHVGSLFPLFLLAIGLAVAYEATGCLLVPIFMHAIFNGCTICVMLLQ